jgi:hypothetical protein
MGIIMPNILKTVPARLDQDPYLYWQNYLVPWPCNRERVSPVL